MSVTVDHAPFSPASLGLRTVGQLLSHVVQQGGRLVTRVLIDGQEPNYDNFAAVRASALDGRTVFVETTCPKEMAREVLDELSLGMAEADRLTAEAVDLLQRNQTSAAMQKLSGCFSTWHTTRESVEKTAQLLRLDLAAIAAGDAS
ncbi:MAG TPA: hypothetical protein VK324_07305, partial [Tepidisphaeraceae bacterium]|nr:hypothetical protein [Tepidisphaeraceae bacterium]